MVQTKQTATKTPGYRLSGKKFSYKPRTNTVRNCSSIESPGPTKKNEKKKKKGKMEKKPQKNSLEY